MDFTYQMLPVSCHIRDNIEKDDPLPLMPMDDFGKGYSKEEWRKIKQCVDVYYTIIEALMKEVNYG